MKIQNYDALAVSKTRKTALAIIEAGLKAIDTNEAVKQGVRVEEDKLLVGDEEFSLHGVKRLVVVGVGKCAVDAACALETVLGNRLSGGIVLDVKRSSKLKHITSEQGTHPFPSDANSKATAKIIEFLNGLNEHDFVLFIISGGGSTLLHTSDNVNAEDETKILQQLFESGAAIQKINTVRKHLSLARGGFLAKYAYPARGASLIFSDVPSDELQFIASGPTVKDTTTIEDAQAVFEKYRLRERCGIGQPAFIETPKDDIYFANIRNILFVSNQRALEVMAEKAKNFGFSAKICTTRLTGEACVLGKQIVETLHDAPSKSALLYGGEPTVTVHGKGKGGRSQELILSALRFVKKGEVIAAVASDGRDNTEFAGALCDTISKERAEKLNVEPNTFLANSDSYHFFKKVGDYILTGDTGSNVADLILAFKE